MMRANPLSQFKMPALMGILNLTPDSFSDGAMFNDPERALEHARSLLEAGAGIIDLGGESTRPGALEVSVEEELQRVLPVLRKLGGLHPRPRISIDTRHARTAEACIAEGANLINDISALRHDPDMAPLLAGFPQVDVILMHMRGQPETMQVAPRYDDLYNDIKGFFIERIEFCEAHGIARERLFLDPGIGFGKTAEHNLALLGALHRFAELGLPIVLGASRKRFIDAISASAPDQRLAGSLAAALVGAMQGVAILRVHDVFAHNQFFKVLRAIVGEKA